MRIVSRLFAAAAAAGAVVLVSASAVSANHGLGPLQTAIDSSAFMYGGADYVYGGSGPPVPGIVAYATFTKGTEAYKSSTTTSVVDFTLPEGVTVVSNPVACANSDGLGDDYCLGVDTTGGCAPPTAVTVDGNTVSFQIACEQGQTFAWNATVSSLITTEGYYSTSVQFKVGPYRRTRDGTNMWQINPTSGEFDVPFEG